MNQVAGQNFELLHLEEVYGAIAYYLANQAGIDAYLDRKSQKWTEEKHNAEPLPAGLRGRLMRAREMQATRAPGAISGFPDGPGGGTPTGARFT